MTRPPMTFEQAVLAPGEKVQLWSENIHGERVQAIYTLTDTGWRELAWRRVLADEHTRATLELTQHGIAVAITDPPCPYIWLVAEGRLSVYGARSRVLEARDGRLLLDIGGPVERADLVRVVAFADRDMEYRGIRVQLRSGTDVDLVTEVSAAAEVGAGYSRNDLLSETGWAVTLGRAIAAWAGVAFENRI